MFFILNREHKKNIVLFQKQRYSKYLIEIFQNWQTAQKNLALDKIQKKSI